MQENEPHGRRTRIPSPDDLLLGIVIGFAVALPFILFSLDFLAQATASLFAATVVALMLAAGFALFLYTQRRRIVSRLFGDVRSSLDAASDAMTEAIRAWPDRERTSESSTRALREGLAVVTWILGRRALTTVILGIAGAVVAMAGTTLLLQQTRALETQNEILVEQRDLLRTQNEIAEEQKRIAAGEGRWEMLWQAHYSPEPSTRIEAAISLANGVPLNELPRLSGLVLEGGVPPNLDVQLSEKPRGASGQLVAEFPLVPVPARLDGALASQSLRDDLPAALLNNVENSTFRYLALDYFGAERHRLSGLRFEQSRVSLGRQDDRERVCVHCVFETTIVRAETSPLRFVYSTFRDTKIWGGMRPVIFDGCVFRSAVLSLVWGQDYITDSLGYAVLVDYHGSAGTSERPGFEESNFETLLFLWSEHEMDPVEGFLTDTVAPSTRIGRILFVEQREGGSRLAVLDEPTSRAKAWNERRPISRTVRGQRPPFFR